MSSRSLSMARYSIGSTARAVSLRGRLGESGVRVSGVPPRIIATVRSPSRNSSSPDTSQIVRRSVSPILNSSRLAGSCEIDTFRASAFRLSFFMPSSGENLRSSFTSEVRLSLMYLDLPSGVGPARPQGGTLIPSMLSQRPQVSFGWRRAAVLLWAEQRGPARVRREAWSITVSQFQQPRVHGGKTAAAGVLHRAAAERGKTRPEDDPGIEQIGIVDHLLAQAGNAFVDQRKNQSIFEIRRRLAARLGPLRLAVGPAVKPLTTFAAELLGGHQLAHPRRKGRVLPTKLLGDDLADVQRDIEAHYIAQLDRSHRHAKVHGYPIDERQRDAIARGPKGLVQIRKQHPVDEKSRPAAARQRQLVYPAHKSQRGGQRLRMRRAGVDHFDQ